MGRSRPVECREVRVPWDVLLAWRVGDRWRLQVPWDLARGLLEVARGEDLEDLEPEDRVGEFRRPSVGMPLGIRVVGGRGAPC